MNARFESAAVHQFSLRNIISVVVGAADGIVMIIIVVETILYVLCV